MKRTPLYEQHVKLGARLVDFAGWEMPLLYRGIQEEHRHTRERSSVFDVSHMGRIEIRGDGAEALLERVCTRRLADMTPGQSRYSHVCNEQGGILDDVIVSRHESHWLVVCNASNRERIVAWIRSHATAADVELRDTTEETAMVAIQGPMTMTRVMGRVPLPVPDLRRYRFFTGAFMGMNYTVCRTGYTGEDGVEVILPAGAAAMAWGFLLAPQDEFEPAIVQPAGLGARDTLRIEAGLPLYGHELHEGVNPIEAGFAWCVDAWKDFIGSEAIRAVRRRGPARRLVGLELDGRRIARQHAAVCVGDRTVGEVTSGTFGPVVQKSIAMAYLATEHSAPGTPVRVAVREGACDAVVRDLPFYRRPTA